MALLHMWSAGTQTAEDPAAGKRAELRSHCLPELDAAPEAHQRSPPRRRWWQVWRR
jgi:hypothetical protein